MLFESQVYHEIIKSQSASWLGSFILPEEAFVTWSEVTVSGAAARFVGEWSALDLQITAPAGAVFVLDVLEGASAANAKPVPLKRLSFDVPPATGPLVARVVMSPARL